MNEYVCICYISTRTMNISVDNPLKALVLQEEIGMINN